LTSPLESLKSLQPEVDYQALMAQMPNHSHPRRKLKEWQNKGYLIRLKKGFYVFSREFLGRGYSPQIVANLMHGPSYVSLESALAFYGLIPERVETVTSVTSRKNKSFETPIGRFTYKHLTTSLYPLGIALKPTEDGRQFLIASPEKALLDTFTLKFDKSARPSTRDITDALEGDLRVDVTALIPMIKRANLEIMKPHYKNRAWGKMLIQFLLEHT